MISAASKAGIIPSLSVVQTLPSRRAKEAPALSSPPKPSEPVAQAVNEPLESDRHLVECAAKLCGDAIDHPAAHHCFADRRYMANGQLPWLIHFNQQDAPGLPWRTVKSPTRSLRGAKHRGNLPAIRYVTRLPRSARNDISAVFALFTSSSILKRKICSRKYRVTFSHLLFFRTLNPFGADGG
jgi:hypothetical protein